MSGFELLEQNYAHLSVFSDMMYVNLSVTAHVDVFILLITVRNKNICSLKTYETEEVVPALKYSFKNMFMYINKVHKSSRS